jgi:hypothetical protein
LRRSSGRGDACDVAHRAQRGATPHRRRGASGPGNRARPGPLRVRRFLGHCCADSPAVTRLGGVVGSAVSVCEGWNVSGAWIHSGSNASDSYGQLTSDRRMWQYNACCKRGCLSPVPGRAHSGAIYEIKNPARKPRDADFVELSAIRRRRKQSQP